MHCYYVDCVFHYLGRIIDNDIIMLHIFACDELHMGLVMNTICCGGSEVPGGWGRSFLLTDCWFRIFEVWFILTFFFYLRCLVATNTLEMIQAAVVRMYVCTFVQYLCV